MTLPPQVLQALMAKLGGVGMGGNAPTSLPLAANGGGGQPAGLGGGVQGTSFPGANTTLPNIAAGAQGDGDLADLKSGSPQNLRSQVPNNMSTQMSSLADLTEGVGPPPGTQYSTPTQGNVGNPAGPIGMPGGDAFDSGMGMPSQGATLPSPTQGQPGLTLGAQLAGLVGSSSTGKPSPGQVLPRRSAKAGMPLSPIFPQTGYSQFNGVLG